MPTLTNQLRYARVYGYKYVVWDFEMQPYSRSRQTLRWCCQVRLVHHRYYAIVLLFHLSGSKAILHPS